MMTPKEKKVINLLVKAYSKFIKLPVMHVADQREFEIGIHALQNIVMSREAIRSNPGLFITETTKRILDDKPPESV